jgi:heat shock protein HslJ
MKNENRLPLEDLIKKSFLKNFLPISGRSCYWHHFEYKKYKVTFKKNKMRYFFTLFILAACLGCSPRLSPDSNWSGRRWVLTEMKGVPVQLSGGRRDAYINFEVAEKRFTGNGGCNQVSGNYSLNKNSIHFSEVIATKMSCEDIAFENSFLSTLSSIDRYEVKGNDLLLKRKREILLVLSAR